MFVLPALKKNSSSVNTKT